jgi:predicted dehydrogenase
VRLGVIGAGSWTVSSHLPNLARHRDVVEFFVVNRRSPDRAGRIQEAFGFARATTDYREVVDAGCDIVVVASPAASHYEHARAALEAGAHVLCEKPFTIDPGEAWKLTDLARRVDRELILAYGWNYRPMVIEARRLMDSDGGIGEIEHVTIHMDSVTRDLLAERGSYPDADPTTVPEPETWSRPETSGGGYGQAQLTHALGIALWLTGLRGAAAFAFMSAPLDANVELHDAIALRYTNGAIGTLGGGSGHAGAAGNRHAVEIRAIGSQGQLHLDLRENILWRYRGSGDEVRVPLAPDAGAYDCVGPVDALVEAGMGRPIANNSPAELGARTVEILDASYRSAASGRVEEIETTQGGMP